MTEEQIIELYDEIMVFDKLSLTIYSSGTGKSTTANSCYRGAWKKGDCICYPSTICYIGNCKDIGTCTTQNTSSNGCPDNYAILIYDVQCK